MHAGPPEFAAALQRIGCTLQPGEHAARRAALAALFAGAAQETRPDGLRYRFLGDDATLAALFGFIAAERTCCSALRLTLEAEPGAGALWLGIAGPPDAVAAVQAAFGGAGE
ncbi:MAG: hypothetical protein QM692_23850 [Thermomicrobiales bacterium]